MTLKIKKLSPEAKLPCLGSKDSAGLDLFITQSADIPPGQRALLPTDIAMSIPQGMVGLIWPRSKLASKKGVAILAGVIDSDYIGNIMISVLNTSDELLELRKGDKVAQMIIQKHYSNMEMIVVDELEETERGESGVNSSELRLR